MANQEDQELAVRNYRSAIEKSVEHDEQSGQYGYNPNWNRTEAEKMCERRMLLDENERIAKERYDSLNCKELTGLSAEEYRHQEINEETKCKMKELRAKKTAEIVASIQNSNDKTNNL